MPLAGRDAANPDEEARAEEIALAADRVIADDLAEQFLAERRLFEAAALVAYGRDLLRRLDCVSEGPATLALWRSFAWTPQGSPKHGFDLTAAAILEARNILGRPSAASS